MDEKEDNKELKQIVPRDLLVREGTSAVACLAGGIFLLILAFAGKLPILGIILSLIAVVIGVGALVSRDREDKKPGLILATAGIMGLIMRFNIPLLGGFLKPLSGFVLGLGAFGLFALGIWKGIKFLKGLNSRR